MLTRLTVRNFKRFEDVAIDLDSPVLFIGPNNSGKTTALQALALWSLGIQRWNEKRSEKSPEKRPGVAISRRDLVTAPGPDAKHLWRNLRVRNVRRVDGKQRTDNIRIEIVVEGNTGGSAWVAGLEFDYANVESFYCRPLRRHAGGDERMPVPDAAASVRVAYLPPMSGLAANELRIEPGGVNVRIGEGRTAEILRNLCFRIHQERPAEWQRLVSNIERLFGVRFDAPRYIPARGEISMSYLEGGVRFDLSASGRGLQQTTLLLAHLALNPNALLLLDEPDAHLEILRQRDIYALLMETAKEARSQIVAASHSEILLHEAAGRDAIIAFVGKPHRIADRGSQVLKALRNIGYADYEQARHAGFVLYLEGTTDHSSLKAFAERVGHEAARQALDAAFVRAVGNQPMKALDHFYGLREALPRLRGCALFDRLAEGLPDMGGVPAAMWTRREIENYFSSERTLLAWAAATEASADTPSLFARSDGERRQEAMAEAIQRVRDAARVLRPGEDPSSPDAKASEDFLEPVFHEFYSIVGMHNRMPKKRFHELAAYIPDADFDPEIREKLDLIAAAHAGAADAEPH